MRVSVVLIACSLSLTAAAQNVVTATSASTKPPVVVYVPAAPVHATTKHLASVNAPVAPVAKQRTQSLFSVSVAATAKPKESVSRSASAIRVSSTTTPGHTPARNLVTIHAPSGPKATAHHTRKPVVAVKHVVRKPTHKPAPKLTANLTPTPFSQNPIMTLRGNAHALIVFAPDTANASLRIQLDFLDHHSLELTQHDTVLVPIVAQHHGAEAIFTGENLNPGSARDQLSARQNFGIKPNDFVVVMLDKSGHEEFRSTKPVTLAEIQAHIIPATVASLR